MISNFQQQFKTVDLINSIGLVAVNMPLPFNYAPHSLQRAQMPQWALLTSLVKGNRRVWSATPSLPRQCTEKNDITPSPKGWLSTPAYDFRWDPCIPESH